VDRFTLTFLTQRRSARPFPLLSGRSQGLIKNLKDRFHGHPFWGVRVDIRNSVLKPLIWWNHVLWNIKTQRIRGTHHRFRVLSLQSELSLAREKPVDIYLGCIRMRCLVQKAYVSATCRNTSPPLSFPQMHRLEAPASELYLWSSESRKSKWETCQLPANLPPASYYETM